MEICRPKRRCPRCRLLPQGKMIPSKQPEKKRQLQRASFLRLCVDRERWQLIPQSQPCQSGCVGPLFFPRFPSTLLPAHLELIYPPPPGYDEDQEYVALFGSNGGNPQLSPTRFLQHRTRCEFFIEV